MLTDPARGLPYREIGLSYLKSFPSHRCDLVSIGLSRPCDPAAYRFDNARRPAACLFQYTLAGEGRFHDQRRQRTWALPAGHGFLAELPSRTRYWLPGPADGVDTSGWRFTYVMLQGDAATSHVRRLLREHGPVIALAPASVPVTIMLDLYRGLVGDAGPDELTINVEMHRLLLELTRALRTPSRSLPEPVAMACEMVQQRLADPALSVDDLAETASYSRYHFTRLFKQHLGVSPYQYVLRQRMRRALTLLTTTDRPIKQIAREVGFTDVSWFCHAFRRQMQTTPTQVRTQPQRLNVSHVYTPE